MKSDDIYRYLFSRGCVPSHEHVWDSDYQLPTKAWFVGPYAEALAQQIRALELQYDPEAFDCEDFGIWATGVARICHARTPGHKKAGLSVGFIAFLPTWSSIYHVILHGICGDEASPEWAFLEPQPQSGDVLEVSLVEKEITSIDTLFI